MSSEAGHLRSGDPWHLSAVDAINARKPVRNSSNTRQCRNMVRLLFSSTTLSIMDTMSQRGPDIHMVTILQLLLCWTKLAASRRRGRFCINCGEPITRCDNPGHSCDEAIGRRFPSGSSARSFGSSGVSIAQPHSFPAGASTHLQTDHLQASRCRHLIRSCPQFCPCVIPAKTTRPAFLAPEETVFIVEPRQAGFTGEVGANEIACDAASSSSLQTHTSHQPTTMSGESSSVDAG